MLCVPADVKATVVELKSPMLKEAVCPSPRIIVLVDDKSTVPVKVLSVFKNASTARTRTAKLSPAVLSVMSVYEVVVTEKESKAAAETVTASR